LNLTSILCLIPTYNEAENIPDIIKIVFSVLKKNGLDGEVIIVDDDSPDGTWEIAEKLKPIYNIKVLRRLDKRGLSSAVIDGFKTASGDIIGVMDADMSHPPEKIPELLQPLLSGDADFVIGSRYVEGARIENWPFLRKVSSKIAAFAVRGLTDVKDPMAGFFFFRRGVIEGLRLNPQGFKIGLEILVKSRCKNVTEVPIVFCDRKFGKSKLGVSVIIADFLHVVKLYLIRYTN
jgi:dolichol-phosphate mannosyltransferase